MQCYEQMSKILEIEAVFQEKGRRIERLGQYLLEQQNRVLADQTETGHGEKESRTAVNAEKREPM